MAKAREAILRLGGAAKTNVFTRIALAIFGQLPWRAVPFLSVELVLLPRWFFFHLCKVSYWSRTVMVPLFILYTFKAQARNPKEISVRELFTEDPWEQTNYFSTRSTLGRMFLLLDRLVLKLYPLMPQWLRRRALKTRKRGLSTGSMAPAGWAPSFRQWLTRTKRSSCWAIRLTIRCVFRKSRRSKTFSLSVQRVLTANRACHLYGIPPGPVSHFRRSEIRAASPALKKPSTGSRKDNCWKDRRTGILTGAR